MVLRVSFSDKCRAMVTKNGSLLGWHFLGIRLRFSQSPRFYQYRSSLPLLVKITTCKTIYLNPWILINMALSVVILIKVTSKPGFTRTRVLITHGFAYDF